MTTSIAPVPKRAAWKALEAHSSKFREVHLRKLFADDPKRGERMTVEALGMALRTTDAAGVERRSHWNTVKLRECTAVRVNDLLDDKGTKTSVSYRFWGNNAGPAANPGCPDSPDGRLLSGRYASTNPVSHRIRDIPFARYDLYLYFYHVAGKSAEEANFVHCLQVRDLETDQTILSPLYAKNMDRPFKTWVRAATNQTENRKDATSAATYVLIPDLGAQDIEVLGSAGSSLCCIQIVKRRPSDK